MIIRKSYMCHLSYHIICSKSIWIPYILVQRDYIICSRFFFKYLIFYNEGNTLLNNSYNIQILSHM